MINKTWDIDVVGILAADEYVQEKLGLQSVFVNSQNSLQFYVKIISDTPETFPNVGLFGGFTSEIGEYFEDKYSDRDSRRESLIDFLHDKLIVFRPRRKIISGGSEVFQITDVRIHQMTSGFQDSTTFIPVPIFSEGKHARSLTEFEEKIRSNRYIGKIAHISTESNDTPTYVLWKGLDGTLTVYGEFEKHLYAHGGFSLQFTDLKRFDFQEEWIDDAFEENDILFVSLDIFNQISNVFREEPSILGTHSESSMISFDAAQANTLLEVNGDSSEETETMVTVPPQVEPMQVIRDESTRTNDERSELAFYEHFSHTARERSLLYDDADLVNFHTAMKSSTLIILAGMSGTGKSRLIEVYGRSLGMDNEQLNIIPVRPSWADDADLIGYVDSIHNVYRPGDSGLIDTLLLAKDNPDKLYMVCFDEMNLARVEHYFSQFLSVLEMPPSRRELRLYNEKLMTRLYNYKDYPPSIPIGDNVMFVGTVNMDESTHHFSDKVLDRANVITLKVLPFKDLRQVKDRRTERNIRRQWTTEEYATFKNTSDGIQFTDDEISLLEEIHLMFQKMDPNRGIGHRIVRQIDAFLKNLPVTGYLTREEAFDLQIVQRILTKVRGPEDQLKRILGTYDPDTKNVIDSEFSDLLQKYFAVSDFSKTRSVIIHKAKELRLHGYTV